MGVLFSPYLTFVLSFLVLYRWVLKLIYDFQWTQFGAVTARFIFCVLYGIIIVYQPDAEQIRLIVRSGFNLLFFDEVINWWFGSVGMKLNRKIERILKRVLNTAKGWVSNGLR